MEGVSGPETLHVIAADHAVHPIQVSQLKMLQREGSSDLLTRRKKTQAKEESQTKEAELYQPYCCAEAWRLRQAPDGAGLAEKSLNGSDARELRKLVDHDHPELTVSRPWELLGLP